MKAPDKIYIAETPNKLIEIWSEEPIEPKPYITEHEYIRKDVLIDWLKEHINDYLVHVETLTLCLMTSKMHFNMGRKKKEEQQEPLVEQQGRIGMVLETIFGNKVQLFVDNIEEMVWYPAGIADIYTARMHYFVKMDALDFDRLVTLRGNRYEKEENE